MAEERGESRSILSRIRDKPEERDLQNGDALNALMEAMNDPRVQESSFRSARVALPADVVRQIPFRIEAEGAEFSMQRLQPRGVSKWPVAFQDDRFNHERKAYERAVDAALEQQIEGKMSFEVIQGVRDAVEGLSRALDTAPSPERKQHIARPGSGSARLQKMAELLGSKRGRARGRRDRHLFRHDGQRPANLHARQQAPASPPP